MAFMRITTALLLILSLSGCAIINTAVKVTGTAVCTTIKTTGAIVSAPFKMVGDSDSDDGE
ncbi:MAG TPA: hypothetical protein VIR63_05870 [Pontiella sp.]